MSTRIVELCNYPAKFVYFAIWHNILLLIFLII